MRMRMIIIGLVFISINIYGQDQREKILLQKIDSIAKALNREQLVVDKTKTELINAKKAIDNYYMEKVIGERLVCVMGTVIKKEPEGYDIICKINTGDKVKVVEVLSDFYKVYFNNIYGYVSKEALEKEEVVLAKNEERQRKRDEEKAQEIKIEQQKNADAIKVEQQKNAEAKIADLKKQEANAKRKATLISKYGQESGLKIFNRKIWLGATKEMVIESWGKPDEVNRSIGVWGVHEQWVYDNNQYIYFENGVLTSWQD